MTTPTNETPAPPYAPYAAPGTNAIYNLLFCDDPRAFAPATQGGAAPWQRSVFAEPANAAELQRLAGDRSQEGRVRYLAFNRLREAGHPATGKELLGIVVEVPVDGGLDALAAYSEGGVRFIHHTGRLSVLEGVPQLRPRVQALFEASKPAVERSGPWDGKRLPPPRGDRVRLTFLASDGLHFGEGEMSTMQRDPLAAPVIAKATELLQAVVALEVK